MTRSAHFSRRAGAFGLLVIALASAVTMGVMTATTVQKGPAHPPAVGEAAQDFSLEALDGSTVRLTTELKAGPVVLVLLRGWPGYQCPYCVRQFGEFRAHAGELEAAGARVLWIYPGALDVAGHAQAFVRGTDVPPSFRVMTDPDFRFTNAYRLRWDAPGETAYPATFVIDTKGTIQFASVSTSHGGRASVAEVLAALAVLTIVKES